MSPVTIGHMVGATGAPLVILLVLLLVPLSTGPARAEDIQPDRPELTESARLVTSSSR
jgi:hypothetical protein